MNKLFSVMLLFVVLLISGGSSFDDKPLYSGYTEEGVYYSVYEESSFFKDLLTANANSKEVTVTVKYEAIVTPPQSIDHTRIIYGKVYSGTIMLYSYKNVDGKTTAVYKGTIYKVS